MNTSSPATGRAAGAARVVCHCAGITARKIRDCAARQPGIAPAAIAAELGCGQQCGSCLPDVQELLGQHAWWPVQVAVAPLSTGRTGDEVERAIYGVRLQPCGPAPYPSARPGQHVVLRMAREGGAVQRSFTIVQQEAGSGALLLAVRRVPGGQLTPGLLDGLGEQAFAVSAPSGEGFTVDDGRAAVFLAGGIGITPAISLFLALPPGARGHLHWSVAHAGDAVLEVQRAAIRVRHPGLTQELHDVSRHGFVQPQDIQRIAEAHPGARFYLCGPPPYVQAIEQALAAAGVPGHDVLIERFSVPAPARAPAWPQRLSFRWKTYLAGLLLAGTTGLLLSQTPEELRPHGHPNVGHERLQCLDCHTPAAGSTRQVLQAKLQHGLGLRERDATFGKMPVSNAACQACHANFDDRHAPSRFLEPRFEPARQSIGAHQCVSCHREHQGVRIAAPQARFCVSCHSELKLSRDPATPTHAELLRRERWDTCLQCHDYHGNHRWKAPQRLEDAIAADRLQAYFRNASSPYGPPVIPARPAASAP